MARSTTPEENAATHALAGGRGSCAALAAAVLALTEPLGEPFRAAVLRDHVALASTAEPGAFYELLDRGKRVTEDELNARRAPAPGGLRIADGQAYLAYYLDNLGTRLAEAGQLDAARGAFDQALQSDPGLARAHYNLGTFLLDQDDSAAAERHLSRALRLGWRDADAYVNRGVARAQLGHPRAARRDFLHALRLEPGNAAARSNLARLDSPSP